MIKRCPVCNRTYSDESISFCLADGALLSPPHEEAGAETAVMTAPTEPATPSPQIPTIAAPPPKPARETYTDSITPASAGAKRLLLATAGLLILAVSLVGAYWLLMRRRAPQETIAAVTNTNTVDGGRAIPSDTSREAASPRAAPSVAVMPTPQNREKATPTASPQLPAKLVVATPAPTVDVPREQPVDYNKIFSGREVTQKARIFSQPRPGYTDSARQNGVSGVVILRMVLASSGEVTNITVVNGLPDGLSEKAIAAARQIKFEPAMKDGRAVSQYVQVSYTFSLY